MGKNLLTLKTVGLQMSSVGISYFTWKNNLRITKGNIKMGL